MPSWLKWTLIVAIIMFVVGNNSVAFGIFASTEFDGIFTLAKTLFHMN